jgi:hypothetical protein
MKSSRALVGHWLAERDDIRLHTVTLEAPEMRACPTKARLDFIGDATAVRRYWWIPFFPATAFSPIRRDFWPRR